MWLDLVLSSRLSCGGLFRAVGLVNVVVFNRRKTTAKLTPSMGYVILVIETKEEVEMVASVYVLTAKSDEVERWTEDNV